MIFISFFLQIKTNYQYNKLLFGNTAQNIHKVKRKSTIDIARAKNAASENIKRNFSINGHPAGAKQRLKK